ncbi:hypothetical protein Taro_010613 [Colocasia esculenta]|uniref:Uncharacterized protein n=1 Tax=Colocasia esculenta TaxID=4460 RepID=A0A843U8Q7_COLES|nr:hypothetical protein [Colocasia esculenta]
MSSKEIDAVSMGSMELTKLNIRDLIQIAVIVIELKMPCYSDFLKNELAPDSLMMKNKPLRGRDWVISTRNAVGFGFEVEEDLVEEGPDEEDAPADEEAGGSSVIDGGRGRIGKEVGERED